MDKSHPVFGEWSEWLELTSHGVLQTPLNRISHGVINRLAKFKMVPLVIEVLHSQLKSLARETIMPICDGRIESLVTSILDVYIKMELTSLFQYGPIFHIKIPLSNLYLVFKRKQHTVQKKITIGNCVLSVFLFRKYNKNRLEKPKTQGKTLVRALASFRTFLTNPGVVNG